jgi:phosphopantothenoylcysteine decarboxylase/phosphopantothenate--cysteine ligase
MATGQANDLATTALLATDKDVLCAPAMNVRMWEHPATRANLETLRGRSVRFVGPTEGDMACGEWGYGRMAEPEDILAAVEAYFAKDRPLAGIRALVTSGPTVEPIDPVRFICNRSSGRQGHAIAAALAEAGAETTLVSGPVDLPDPPGVRTVSVETARQMLAACESALPVEVAVCAAAVCDWRPVGEAGEKIKKGEGAPPALALAENPDILATLSRRREQRPGLVIGFAAETSDLVANAQAKLARKGCDWIVGNDVSAASGTFGGADNAVVLISANGAEPWPRMSKEAVAKRLVEAAAAHLGRRP